MRASRGEIKIEEILKKSGIPFQEEYSFPDLYSSNGRPLRFDFAVFDDDDNLLFLIEYQGIQHYIDIEIQSRKNYKYIHENDLLKNELCKKNGIKLFYFTEKVIYENYCKDKELTYYDFNSMIKDIENECTS